MLLNVIKSLPKFQKDVIK